jgi:hypothetical protein
MVAVGALCSLFFTRYHSADQTKKTEMGRACSTYGAEKKCVQDFKGKT